MKFIISQAVLALVSASSQLRHYPGVTFLPNHVRHQKPSRFGLSLQKQQLQWKAAPDYGEGDEDILPREAQDKSKWVNPKSIPDDGHGDDAVVLQIMSKLMYNSSEGPTKVDNGELDEVVVNREHDIANGYKYGGFGLTAWHNPLADADDGAGDTWGIVLRHEEEPKPDDEEVEDELVQVRVNDGPDDTVVLQVKQKLRFDSSEGPTKVDNGELDEVVVNREHDIANGYKYGGYGIEAWHNPLMDADDGMGDDFGIVLRKDEEPKPDDDEVEDELTQLSVQDPSPYEGVFTKKEPFHEPTKEDGETELAQSQDMSAFD